MAVELADFDLGADRRMSDVEPCQRDVLLEHRRAHAAGNLADLGAADMDAVAMTDRLIGVDVETNQLARGCSLRRISASLPMKSSVLVLSGTVKPMPASNGSVWSENS